MIEERVLNEDGKLLVTVAAIITAAQIANPALMNLIQSPSAALEQAANLIRYAKQFNEFVKNP